MLIRQLKGISLIELILAIFLGSLLCEGLFHIYLSLNYLHQQQTVLSTIQQSMRFTVNFLREKIHNAGDWSCESKKPSSRSITLQILNSDDALQKLGLTIKSDTDLLRMHECIRFHDQRQYLPITFFVADTYRLDAHHHPIYALFFKINHHPREELVTGLTKFTITAGIFDPKKENIRKFIKPSSDVDWKKIGAVKIHFLLFSMDDFFKKPHSYFFNNKKITPSDRAFYQWGNLYVALRTH